jgi:hypothetical protein
MTGFLEQVLRAGAQLGKIAQSARSAAGDAYEGVSPHIQTFLDGARRLSEPQARQAITDQVGKMTAQFAANSSEALQRLFAGLELTLKGMHPQLALRVLTLRQLQAAANAKQALELHQLAACDRAIADLNNSVKANPQLDVNPRLAAIDLLLTDAARVVDAFDASETAVSLKLVDAGRLLEEIRAIEAQCLSAQADLLARVRAPTTIVMDAGGWIAELAEDLLLADARVAEQHFAAAAVALNEWTARASELLAQRKHLLEALQREARGPESVEGRLSALFGRAERLGLVGEGGDAALTAAAADALALARQRPCDMEAARGALDGFMQKLRTAETTKAKGAA